MSFIRGFFEPYNPDHKFLFFISGYDRLQVLYLDTLVMYEDETYVSNFVNDFSTMIENHQYLELLKIYTEAEFFVDKIIRAITNNKTIKELDLLGVTIDYDPDYQSLKEMFLNNNTLQTLEVSDFVNYNIIFECLRENETIKEILFYGNDIYRSDDMFIELNKLLDVNFTLIKYYIPIPPEDKFLKKQINQKIKRNIKINENKRFLATKAIYQNYP